MKAFQFVSFAVLTLVAVPFGHAQVNLSASRFFVGQTITGSDAEYDFDVYARSVMPTTKYFIVYTLEDGSTHEIGPISSYDEAAREIYFNFEHDLSPAGSVDADIEARPVLEPLTKFGRYGTYYEAVSVAWQLETFGLETDIRSVRSIQLRVKRFPSLRYSR